MHSFPVSTIMKISDNPYGDEIEGRNIVFHMQKQAMEFYIKNKDAQPTEEHFRQVIEFYSDTTGILFNIDEIKAILSLYPHVRIKLAVYEGTFDTDVRDMLSSAITHFFLKCEWPTYGDNVDIDKFIEILQEQARFMGYLVPYEDDN